MHSPATRLRRVANWLNLSTPVGLVVALAGRSTLRPGPDGLILAERYRLRFPIAGAFTIGDVVASASDLDELERRLPGTLAHEGRHAWQWALAGPWFLPGYLLASAWSLARTGHPAVRNVFERHAGLVSGGYVDAASGEAIAPSWLVSRRRGR